jgi:hypothetical protein
MNLNLRLVSNSSRSNPDPGIKYFPNQFILLIAANNFCICKEIIQNKRLKKNIKAIAPFYFSVNLSKNVERVPDVWKRFPYSYLD